MNTEIANTWLHDVAETAKSRNFKAHMDLISNRVNLVGVPGFENIGYDDWAAQCKHEFENNIIKSVKYNGFKLVSTTTSHIMFKTYEIVEASDGTINAHGIEVLLEKEDDGKWRLVQERILPPDETAHDRLI